MTYFFLSMLCFAISDSLWKVPLKYIDAPICIIYRNIGTTILFGLALIFFYEHKTLLFWENIFEAIIISTLAYGGLYYFSKAQKYTKLSLIVPLLNFGAVVQFLMAVFYWGEEVSILKLITFLLGIVFSLLISFNPKENFKFYDKGIKYALFASVFWAVSYSFFKQEVMQLGAILFGFILEITAVFLTLLIHILPQKQWNKLTDRSSFVKALPFTSIIAILGALGVYFNLLGYEKISISSAVIISLLGNLIPISFGYFFYKERLRPLQYVGIGFALIVLVLFQLV